MIELLVVIAIISILTASLIAIFNPTRIKQQVRDAARKSTLARVATGLSDFEVSYESYPRVLSDLVPNILIMVPKSPTGADLGYEAAGHSGELCATEARTCKKVVLYDFLESPKKPCESGISYWVWTSGSGRLGKICSSTPPTSDGTPIDDL